MLIRLTAFVLTGLLSVGAAAEDAESAKRFIVHLEVGENWDPALQPGEQTQFKEHSANMSRLRKEGTILFGARYGEYGLLIFEGESLDSVRDTLEADPGVLAGIFEFRIEPASIFYPWKTVDD